MSFVIHIMTGHRLRLLLSANMLNLHHAVAYGHIGRSNTL